VHNAEEWLTIGRALPRVGTALSGLLRQPVALPSLATYRVALAVVTVLGFVAYAAAVRWPPARYGLVVLQAVMALNIATHVALALLLRGYAPGVVTAVLVEGPTSWLIYRSLRKEPWVAAWQWRWLLPLAILVHAALLLALLPSAVAN
jgi:hypothetical protein